MRGLTSAVHWWEEWQLRVLVLSSVAVQVLLIIFSSLRRFTIPGWVRSITWLAYLAGDAVAIYALATLFNRHKDQGGGGSNISTLEVMWAPVLLLHFGGHDGITAYNIEDNELWSRHVVTAVSQVTVAIYVFCKSWPPDGDKRLLLAGILLFLPGVLKCFAKPWALKSASIYSLVSSSRDATARQNEEEDMYPLQEYVKRAKEFLDVQEHGKERDQVRKQLLVLGEVSDKLFVDLSSPYPLRLRILKYFWGISQDTAYGHAQGGLVAAFLLLYTRLKTAGFVTYTEVALGLNSCDFLKISCRCLIQLSRMVLPWASIGLFHRSHHSEEARNDIIDVKITYAIFCCTAVLEFFAAFPFGFWDLDNVYLSQERVVKWPQMVAQYSFIGYFASNKKHSSWMRIADIFGCKDFVDQRILCMKPCSSSARISRLVLGYLKDGWKEEIHDAPSYRRFNDHSTHWPKLLGYLEEGHHVGFSSSMRKRAFDESVLLLHIATDFCFFLSLAASEHTCGLDDSDCSACKVVQCNEMSNYMVYLLFVNPEMLLPGTRRNLFIDAYDGLNHILNDMDMDMDIPMGRKPPNVEKHKWVMLQRVINTMQKRNRSKKASEPCPGEEPKKVSPPEEEGSPSSKDKSNKKKGGRSKEKLIDDAWALAQRLLDNKKGDEKKMWEEIQRVWVEMLCFSASRCRGYLHAKSLGEGGEFLSYVWLTLFHMGAETFTDKLQREEPPSTSTTAPSTCEICIIDVSTTGAGAAPSTSEICMGEEDMVNVSTTGTTAPSTSEICIIDVFTTDAGAAPSTS
ncbi:uncharacterized protein [Miscanthus floridulus]|uniref:uncharacterized protein n=1 Tax=Miscanthus floridulus TaxID=154761 RepID=UPI0034579317